LTLRRSARNSGRIFSADCRRLRSSRARRTRRRMAPSARRQRGAGEGADGGRTSWENATGGRRRPAARCRRVWRRAHACVDVGHWAELAARELRGMAGLSESVDQCSVLGDAPNLRGSVAASLLQVRSITKRFSSASCCAIADPIHCKSDGSSSNWSPIPCASKEWTRR
jgi:hypothetical protein